MFWMRLGTCSSVIPLSPFFSLFCFSFLFFVMVFPFWLSISLTSNSFLPFFSHYGFWFFYINHAIVTPLHPLGLLVSKKNYIYPCSRYANNPYTLVAFVSSFLFLLCLPFSLSLFSSITCLLLYHLSSPLLSSCSSSSHLDYRFPSPLCSSRLSFLTFLLFFPCFFFLLLLYRHKSFVNVNITYVAGLSPSLYVFSLSSSSAIATTTALLNFSFSFHLLPPSLHLPRLFSLYFLITPSIPSYLFLTPFSTILIPFSPFLSPPPTFLQSTNQPISLSPFLPP